MMEFTMLLQEQLEGRLVAIEQEADNFLQQAELSIPVIQEKVQELRNYIAAYEFKDGDEEIHFFKNIQPRLYSKLIYYIRVFQVETRRPAACIDLQRKLLESELKAITQFFDQNLDFYQYYRSGGAFLDAEYFKRGKYTLKSFLDEYSLLMDPSFCTTHSYKVSKIMAYEQLQSYLNSSLRNLDQKHEIAQGTEMKQSVPEWTGSKSDLTELAYAFYSASALNKGNVSISRIISFLEALFDMKLGNYSQVFQQMRMRKKNKTAFLDKLRDALVHYMDTVDERWAER